MYLLPTFWPPNAPTHQLVFAPNDPNIHTIPLLTPTTCPPRAHLVPINHEPKSTLATDRFLLSRLSFGHPAGRNGLITPITPVDDMVYTAPSSTGPSLPSVGICSTISSTPPALFTPGACTAHIAPDTCTLCFPQPRTHLPPNRKYELNMRQQPLQARMWRDGEKCKCLFGYFAVERMENGVLISCIADRRPIDPPPIVQLQVLDNDEPLSGSVGDKGKTGKRSKKDVGGMNFMHSKPIFVLLVLGDTSPIEMEHTSLLVG